MQTETLIALDRQHLLHPYSTLNPSNPLFAVERAQGCLLQLSDGRTLVDGMSSWWAAIHGYNHPVLNNALAQQTQKMAHVMFGGLTHAPAVELGQTLAAISPAGLDRVFLCDSGSVSVEVAIKMAIQYWQALGKPEKHQFISLEGGYHGDTLGAMSLCDPTTGMHHLFTGILPQQRFIPGPTPAFGEACQPHHLAALEQLLQQHSQHIAALVVEPIVQGAGGMRFYSAQWLAGAKALCQRYQVLLIADEIATGFGRTGALFACQHAGISPDILCLGKALTGGYLTLAATLTRTDIIETLCQGHAQAFMHGPTFMANPLACAVANASIQLLLNSPWQNRVADIQQQLIAELAPCKHLPAVADVRCLGAIGVVEFKQPLAMQQVQPWLVDQGVWLRPFGKLAYCMPPFIIQPQQLRKITQTLCALAEHLSATPVQGHSV